jgi:hypothetical protein
MALRLAAIVFALAALPDVGLERPIGSTPRQNPPLFTRSLLHAHNCYPDEGRWADRLDRALATGLRPIAIEQDVAWVAAADGTGRSVVAHDDPATGQEPTLESYFFDKLRPLMDAALASPRPDTWPLVVLHLDFKTNERAHHRAIWDLLGRHERWLTTAPRVAGDATQAFAVGPMLVLTENGAGQSAVFYDEVPVGGRLRIFGTVPPVVLASPTADRETEFDAAINASPQQLMPSGTTNYRRWINFSWIVVERGGQARAGDWTNADDRRLGAIVTRAHSLGLWIRFYTLNGHPAAGGDGWTASYNFGSIEAVRPRWRAAVNAGVDFIATDQYEGLASLFADVGR